MGKEKNKDKKEKQDKKIKNKDEFKNKKIKENKENSKTKSVKAKEKKVYNKDNKLCFLKKKISLQTFVLSLIITLSICIALILFINLVVKDGTLGSIDFTSSKLYRLSKKSKEIIKSVDEEIEINIDNSMNYTQVQEILDQVMKLNNKIKVVKADLKIGEGEQAQEYATTVIVKAPEREEMAVSFFDLKYDSTIIDYSSFKQYSLFEESLVNSIISVINSDSEKMPSVAFLSHMETLNLNEQLYTLYTELRLFGIMPIQINLDKQDIPESIKIIAIVGPQKDLSQKAYSKLIDFQAKGGDFVIGITHDKSKKLPLLDKFLSSYGVSIPFGHMLDYRDQNRYQVMQKNDVIAKYNNILLPIVSSKTDMTKDIALENRAPIFFFPSKIVFESEENLKKKNLTFENHVITSEEAVFKTKITDIDISSYEKPENDKTDIYVLGTIATKKLSEQKNSRAVIYANYLFMTDFLIQDFIDNDIILLGDNLKLAKNSFKYLHPLSEKMIEVRKPIVISQYKLDLITFKRNKIIVYTFYLVPAIIILISGVVYMYKKGIFARYDFLNRGRDK